MVKKRELGKDNSSSGAGSGGKTGLEQFHKGFGGMAEGYIHCRVIHENESAQDWVYLAANDAFERLTGAKGVVGKCASEVMPGMRETHPGLFETGLRVSQTGQPEKFEMFVKASQAWFSVSVFSMELDSFAAIFEDITTRKEAEAKLRERTEYFRTVANFTYDWEYWLDDQRRVLYASPSCERITGYSAVTFEQNPSLLEKIVHSQDRSLYRHHQQEEITKAEPLSLDFRIVTADGEVRWINHACQQVRDAGGRPMGRRASNRDITRRRQMEQALRENESILNMSEEVAKTGSWRWDLRTRKAAWSDQMFRLFEVEREEFDGDMNRVIAERVHPDDAEAVLEFNRSILKGISSIASITCRIVLPGGMERTVRAHGKLVRDDDGHPISMTGYVQEITEWVKVKNQFRQMKRLYAALSQVNRAVAQAKDTTSLYSSVCEAAVKHGELAAAWVELLDEASGELHPISASGLDVDKWSLPIVNINRKSNQNGVIVEAFRNCRVAASEDLQTDERTRSLYKHFGKFEFRSLASAPIQAQGKTIGVLSLASTEAGFFKAEEELGLVEEIGLAISCALERGESLRESEGKMQSIFRAAPTGIGVVVDRVLLDVNTRICELTGYSKEELIGQSARILYPTQEEFEFVGREKYRQISEKGTGQVETRWLKKDGSIIDVLLASTPIDVTDRSKGVTFTALDITDRKQTEKALRESEERHRQVSALMSDYVYCGLVFPDGSVKSDWVSGAFERITGYSLEEINRMEGGFSSLVYREDLEAVMQKQPTLLANGSLYTEYRITRKDGEIRWLSDYMKYMQEDKSGTGNPMIGAVRDITEQKQAGEALRQSEERFRMLFDKAPLGYQSLDIDGRFIDVNQAWLDVMGYSREEVLGRWFGEFLSPEYVDAFRERFPLFKSAGQIHSEFEMPHKNGSKHWIAFDGRIGYELNGEFKQTHCILQDITDRKQVEKALRESEDKFKYVFDNSTVAKSITKINGTLHPNQAFCEMTGYSEEELNNTPWQEITHPDDVDLNVRELNEILAGQKESARFIKRYIHKNGSIVWVDLSTSLRRGSDGAPLYFVTTALDITERKRAEEELQKSEEQFRQLAENIREVFWLGSTDWDQVFYISPAYEEIWGRSRTELYAQPRSWLDGIVAEDFQKISEAIRAYDPKNQMPIIFPEYRITRPDGSQRWIAARGFPIFDTASQSYRIAGLAEDITERKKAEEELQQEQLFSKLVIDSLPGIFYLYTYPEHRLVLWNKQHETLLGFSGEEIKDRFVADWHVPQARDAVFKAIEEVMEKGQSSVESPLVAKDGHLIPFFLTGVKFEARGRLFYMGIGIDITERKQAEERQQLLLSIIERSRDFIGVASVDQRAIYVNLAGQAMVGLDGDEAVKATKIEDYFFPEDLPFVNETILSTLMREGRWVGEFRFRHFKTGKPIRVHYDLFRTENPATGEVTNFSTVSRDITELKRAEEVLRESEDKFRKAFMTSPDSVNINRLQDGMYISINPGFTQIMGYTEADAIGKTSLELNIWEDPQDRARLVEGLKKDGFVDNLEASFRRKDGGTKYGLMSASVIELGGIPHILSITRDITDRKQAEEAIHQSERQMKALLTSLDDIVFEFDRNGTYLNIWAADESLLVMPKAQMLGRNVLEVMGSEHGTPFDHAIKLSLTGNIPQIIEYPLEVIGGKRWFMARVSPILSPEGSTHTVSVLVRDITEHKRIEEQVQVQLQRVRALNEIDRAISSSLDMRLSLDILLIQTLSQLGVDAACVLLLNPSSQTLEYVTGRGFRSTVIRDSRVMLGQGFPGQAGLERRTMHVPDIKAEEGKFIRKKLLTEEGFVEYFCVPLIAKGLLKGVLEIFNRSRRTPDMEWMDYLETLGGQAAIAIDNAQLFEGMQRSNLELVAAYDATIEGWSRAMDLRDKETEGHTLRVTEWTMKLAKKMGVGQHEITHMRRGALLHDIGKLGVPDHILHKTEGLDRLEWAVMRQHPTYAFNMLLPIAYLRPALDIPYCHHEKWDGTGYPRGLKGEEIPLAARIFAVVDVWDALCSDRPYRRGWVKGKVREHLVAESGRHFDPQVVDAFLQIIEDDD